MPWISALLIAVAVALAARPGLAQTLTPEKRAQLIERAESIVKDKAFSSGVDFEKAWAPIREKYKARLDAAEDAGGLTRVLNRAFNELGVSHLELLSPRAAENARRGTMVGIGIVSNPDREGVVITGLVDDAPAKAAGLKVGDRIVEVNDQPLLSTEQIRGEEGTKVKLKVKHEDGDLSDVELVRRRFSTREPESLMALEDDAFVLAVPTFAAGYDRDQIEKFLGKARKTKNLIIDLRDNSGGDFDNMIHFLSCLLPADSRIGTQVGRDLSDSFAKATGGDAADPVAVAAWAKNKVRIRRNPITPFPGKIAVLINGASASASEIVAAALCEIRLAPLVGTRTAGAVLVSTYMPAGDGFQMKVPISEWVTIKGRRLEGNPLVADIQTGRTRRGDDRVAKVALEHLRGLE